MKGRKAPTAGRRLFRPYGLAWLALLAAFGAVMLWIALDLNARVPDAPRLAYRALAPPSPTAVPTKFALWVSPTPSPAPTTTPTPTPTSTSNPTSTPTKRPIPSRTRTTAPSPSRSATTAAAPKAALAASTPLPALAESTSDVDETYAALSVISSPADRTRAPFELNLTLRGYAATKSTPDLVHYEGPFDAGAPQLYGLFADERTPTLTATFQVNDWDWGCQCRGGLIGEPEVTVIGLAVTPGELIRVPRSSYYIGGDLQVLVLYADPDRITLNYTRDGNAARGYTIYLESIAVDGSLLALYRQMDGGGRGELPALRAGQGLARARASEIQVAIRDSGAFLDPRSRKDWWRGR